MNQAVVNHIEPLEIQPEEDPEEDDFDLDLLEVPSENKVPE